MAASTLEDTKVITSDGEDVGKISEIMLDVRGGRIVAAVVSTVLVPLTHCADPS
jgi:sporulation protein YlmC with PRC-barrel domain